MKKYKIIFLIIGLIFTILFWGCSDDKDGVEPPINEEFPELQFDSKTALIKVGNENKYTLDIKQGGGEYNVFSLDEKVAKAEVVDNKVIIEGVANGMTSIVVSDKSGSYRKLPVRVYTFDKVELDTYNLNLITKLGNAGSVTTTILSGNGQYKAIADDPDIAISILDDGMIMIGAISEIDDQIINITVTDVSGFSASIALTIESTLIPFTDGELDEIKRDKTRRYNINERTINQSYFSYYNEIDNGQQLYGFDYYSWYYYKLWYTGDKSVGKKENARFSYNYSGPSYADEPVDFEIIKNDGENIWGIISFVKDNVLQYGYFCDKI